MAPVCSRPVIAAGGPPRRQPYRGGPFWRYPIARMTEGIPVAMSKATSRAMSGVLKRYEGPGRRQPLAHPCRFIGPSSRF